MSSLDNDGNEIKDGFRKRKKRREGWETGALKRGEIREPGSPRPERKERGPNDVGINVPVATLNGTGE